MRMNIKNINPLVKIKLFAFLLYFILFSFFFFFLFFFCICQTKFMLVVQLINVSVFAILKLLVLLYIIPYKLLSSISIMPGLCLN